MSSQTSGEMFYVFTDTRRDVLCLHRHRARCFMSSQTPGNLPSSSHGLVRRVQVKISGWNQLPLSPLFQQKAGQAQAVDSGQDFGMESVASVATVPAKGRSGSGGRFGSGFQDGIGCLCRHCSSKRPVRLRRSIRVRFESFTGNTQSRGR
jgi:hypothetical protein